MKSIILKILLPILIVTTVIYLPIFQNQNILVNRGNDLTEFFWPIVYYVRESIFKYHQIPLWNNLFFSGTPLLPDPQSPIFYLPNILFLLFKNIDTGFIVSIFLHIYFAAIGFYFLAKKGYKFSQRTSVILACLYIVQPKLAGYIEAGHFGLITSWTWLPLTYLSAILLAKKPNIKRALFLAISLSALFYTHILVFGIATISVIILQIFLRSKLKFSLLAFIFLFLFITPTLFPQIAWQKDTTRSLLLISPDVYPKWLGIKDFLRSTLFLNLETEKTIALGFFTSILAVIGFFKLKPKHRLVTAILIVSIIIISMNNSSPIYEILIKQNWYILLRVSTRFWFMIIFIVLYLAGLALEKLNKKLIIKLIATLAFVELLLSSWTLIKKPIKPNELLAPKEVYEFLSSDKDRFRVFCLNRCLSQKEAAIYNLELADGYGTLQQKNYYDYSQQLSQNYYRDRYTLSIPPFEIFLYEKLQPYSPALAAYRIKYIISDHKLKDKNLIPVKTIDTLIIYKNELFKNPNYITYTPNFIKVRVTSQNSNKLIIPEVYNKNWVAYLNGITKVEVKETAEKTRYVDINEDTEFVDFKYVPWKFPEAIFSFNQLY